MICPKFQVLISHFFKVNELLDEHKAKNMQSENISTPIYVKGDQGFAYKKSGISCLALIFNLNNPRTTILYAKKSVAGCEIQRVIYRFLQSTDTNLLLSG